MTGGLEVRAALRSLSGHAMHSAHTRSWAWTAAAPTANSTPQADAVMIMSMPADAAWPDSVIDPDRKAQHYATHRHPRPAATTRRPVVTAVRTGITRLADALISTTVVLAAAIICAGAAGADPSQQDQFVALLEQEQIPPIDDGEVAGVVARAQQVCGELKGGSSVDTLVNDEMNRGYEDNPRLHLYPDRVRRTAVRFITASVNVYCPSHQRELPPYE
jgi:Protein of unknown function (DUF732)